MTTIAIPKRSTQLKRKFFERNAESVARDLLGRTMVLRRPSGADVYARIHETAAWEGEADSMNEGLLYAPASLIVSKKFGQRMLDIATNEICVPSCVTFYSAEVFDGRGSRGLIEGPGKLARELKIDDNYYGMPLGVSDVWIGGSPISSDQIRQRRLARQPNNFVGRFYFRE